jgi:hypothetical protein
MTKLNKGIHVHMQDGRKADNTNESDVEGIGNSRAAKRRAKKREKKRKVEEGVTAAMEVVSIPVNHKGKSATNGTSITSSTFPTNEERSSPNNNNNSKKKRSKNMKSSLGFSNNWDNNLSSDAMMEEFCPTIHDILYHHKYGKLSTVDLPPSWLDSNNSSQHYARGILQSLLYPAGITVKQFYSTYWEKEPLYISASEEDDNVDTQRVWSKGRSIHPKQDRFQGIFSSREMKHMIQSHGLLYKYDLNVTKCDGNYRRIHMDSNDTNEGTNAASSSSIATTSTTAGAPPTPQVADVRVVWDHFEADGCTIRFLCPQKHHDTLHRLLSTMESEFGCMVGCNAYLTPGYASQGFAPHYDDIEAFILQLEGKKRWKVYAPLQGQETLPRISSDDFVMVGTTTTTRDRNDHDHNDYDSDEDEHTNDSDHQTTSNATIRDDGRRQILDNPVLDIVLLPGDMLYIPRGWIHQAVTLPREKDPSLHLTISCMQRWAWADLMELIIPEALKAAVEHESYTTLREGLPRNFLSYMGVIHEEVMSENIEGIRQAETATKVAASAADVTDTNAHVDEGQEEPQKVIKKVMLRKLFVERMKKCMHKVFHEESTMKRKHIYTHIHLFYSSSLGIIPYTRHFLLFSPLHMIGFENGRCWM